MVWDCGTLVPIELLSFEAEGVDDDYVEISWVTASEINNDYFEVERSLDGELWEPILSKDGAGNSSLVIKYLAYDRDPYLGYSYYRLKQVDFDGSYTYTSPVSVYFSDVETISIYPNPVTDETMLRMNSAQNGIGQFLVYSVDGKLVESINFEVIVGVNKIKLDLNVLSAGTYNAKIISPDSKSYDEKIIKLN